MSTKDILHETNSRLTDRLIPSQNLQPYVDVRPVSTKYSFLPVVDPRKKSHVPLVNNPKFNVNKVFNPGNTQSPWSGFEVNLESELRNQIHPLQKSSQAVYVPSSTSDLYSFNFTPSIKGVQTHPLLFTKPQFAPVNPNPTGAGSGIFHNSTRTQILSE
jgi:hypothetical protein